MSIMRQLRGESAQVDAHVHQLRMFHLAALDAAEYRLQLARAAREQRRTELRNTYV